MKTKVIFSTVIGEVAIEADMDFGMSDEFLNGGSEAWRDGVLARVAIPKSDPEQWREGHQHTDLWFQIAVCHDLDLLRKQNEEYAAKETDGRHHVDLKTLEIRELLIDGKYFRIMWAFDDVFGGKRLFAGAQYQIVQGHRDNKDAFHVGLPIELTVYF